MQRRGPGARRRALYRFQSLSGFPMSCNNRGADLRPTLHGFQSLSGFPMSCNKEEEERVHDAIMVSIPIGFSNELQPTPGSGTVAGGTVSIPIGFSNELQLGRSARSAARPSRFQSLSGFPMSCNPPSPVAPTCSAVFQSLSGFPMSCNRTKENITAPV